MGEFRFDSLFDYGNELEDVDAVNLVNGYYSHLMTVVQPHLQEENEKRKKTGHLTYPYFIPRWLPNGVQTYNHGQKLLRHMEITIIFSLAVNSPISHHER